MKKILVVNGPNLNMLGVREPDKYGNTRLEDIISKCREIADSYGYEISDFQSNGEGEIVNFIQKEGANASGMIINAGAYTHTSIAIRDAILSVKIPFVEVHISNIFSREPFRHHSYLSDIAIGVISGFRENSYYFGLLHLLSYLGEKIRI
ncbi:MAG: type II 3-dehydroquinate dehydratase [Spirochaetia bacterium]|nr:type II 3-dehydroquinate dehydratase [Spirochaetota bacterium]MCX8096481.1 type II 3-dehydroquinate dehydratase [Spirochaetota bacterium]MDW8113157.1 type II 3-dehydroquinate dehydratase [Spirochaetia bacterium]